jgi:hypothetical protein
MVNGGGGEWRGGFVAATQGDGVMKVATKP